MHWNCLICIGHCLDGVPMDKIALATYNFTDISEVTCMRDETVSDD